MPFTNLGLKPEILRAIAEVGYTEPTPIQAQAVPAILGGHDLIGSAQTGTGKTAAFVWPILQVLMENPGSGGVRALVLEPTRELAQQVEHNLLDYGKYTGLRHTVLYGGVGLARQQTALKEGIDILVATPGRLLDHMDRGNLFFFDLRFLVLDEADRMTDMGFLPDLKRILKRLPAGKQTLLFSATIPPEIDLLARATLWEPVEINIGERAAPAEGVTHEVYPVRAGEKIEALRRLLVTKAPDSTLIFTKTKKGANELGEALREAGMPVGILHSDRTQQARELSLKKFKEGEYKFLVATDIAARGLDIDGITHIVNYDVPLYPEDYVHRIGRTARAKAVGEALTLVTPDEERRIRSIEKLVKQKLPRMSLDGEPLAAPSREEVERRSAPDAPRRRAPGRGRPGEARRSAGPRTRRERAPQAEAAADEAAAPIASAELPVPSANGEGGEAKKRRRRGRRGGRRRRKPEGAVAGANAVEGALPTNGSAPTGAPRAERAGAGSPRSERGPRRERTGEPRGERGPRSERPPRSERAGAPRGERAAAGRRAPSASQRTPRERGTSPREAPKPTAKKQPAEKPAKRSFLGRLISGLGGRGKS